MSGRDEHDGDDALDGVSVDEVLAEPYVHDGIPGDRYGVTLTRVPRYRTVWEHEEKPTDYVSAARAVTMRSVQPLHDEKPVDAVSIVARAFAHSPAMARARAADPAGGEAGDAAPDDVTTDKAQDQEAHREEDMAKAMDMVSGKDGMTMEQAYDAVVHARRGVLPQKLMASGDSTNKHYAGIRIGGGKNVRLSREGANAAWRLFVDDEELKPEHLGNALTERTLARIRQVMEYLPPGAASRGAREAYKKTMQRLAKAAEKSKTPTRPAARPAAATTAAATAPAAAGTSTPAPRPSLGPARPPKPPLPPAAAATGGGSSARGDGAGAGAGPGFATPGAVRAPAGRDTDPRGAPTPVTLGPGPPGGRWDEAEFADLNKQHDALPPPIGSRVAARGPRSDVTPEENAYAMRTAPAVPVGYMSNTAGAPTFEQQQKALAAVTKKIDEAVAAYAEHTPLGTNLTHVIEPLVNRKDGRKIQTRVVVWRGTRLDDKAPIGMVRDAARAISASLHMFQDPEHRGIYRAIWETLATDAAHLSFREAAFANEALARERAKK
jgi:hypothetical protein